MFKKGCFILVLLAVNACAPSPIQLTSTADASQAQTETAVPSATSTPSPTLTPTPTTIPTETPIPTPLGGGSGNLTFPVYIFSKEEGAKFFTLSGTSIYQANSNGTNLKQILNHTQIESIIGINHQRIYYYSFYGENYFVADGDLYIISDDWKLISKVDLNAGDISIYTISSEGRYFIYETMDRNKFIANLDGKGTKLLAGANDFFIGISADSTTIYYNRDFGRETWAVNSDGTNKHKLTLEALKNSTPYEGTPLPKDVIKVSYYPRVDTMAISQDKKLVAFTWFNLLFVTDAADVEFSSPRLVARLPEGAHTLVWSPNGDYLLVGLYFCENNACNFGDIVLVNVIQNRVERVFPSAEYKNATLCGFSPDSKQIIFSFDNIIRLVERDGQSLIDIGTQGSPSCPVWQQ